MKVVAAVCARMGSSRLPGKTLLLIHGRPMLLRLIDRLRFCERLDSIVVATTARPENRVIVKLCKREGIQCVVAQTQDDAQVVSRLCLAAEHILADAIVRVTPDEPLIDPMLVDEVIARGTGQWNYGLVGWVLPDYCSNVFPRRTYPDGCDVEFLTVECLKILPEAENPTAYIWEHPERFRIAAVVNEENLSKLNWTVNYPEDLEFVRWVYERLPEGFGWRNVLALSPQAPQEMLCRFDPREAESGRRRSY